MTNLPVDFINEMKMILKDDYQSYESCFEKEAFRGISVNTLKITPEKLSRLLPFEIRKSPFYKYGYYIPLQEQGIGNLPLHHSGAFYVQEPSASSAVSLLNVKPGDRVLDLCAAPGGKSSQIAACLEGKGLIWANEVVKSRAQVLLSNFERIGISNGVVSSLYPDVLCSKLGGFFDKVLVDAPCSGEGMFRKNPEAIDEWSREHVLACAQRQLSILDSASSAVKDGGILVYSTCTFSYEENEGVVKNFLDKHPEFEACNISEPFGRKTELECALRITPVEGGEGHFAAKLKKRGEAKIYDFNTSGIVYKNDKLYQTAEKELADIFKSLSISKALIINDKMYILPEMLPDINGINVIRAGVLAGEFRKNRFEPAHSLFTSSKPENFQRVLKLEVNDRRIYDYLHGLEIECECGNGYTAVSYCGMVLGFGKCSGGKLKNKYPKGLRI